MRWKLALFKKETFVAELLRLIFVTSEKQKSSDGRGGGKTRGGRAEADKGGIAGSRRPLATHSKTPLFAALRDAPP